MDGFWAFFWLAVVLKIPIVALLLLVWYAIKEPMPEQGPSDGGGSDRDPHPRRPRQPRPPRRGPHADPAPSSPPRVRAAGRRFSRPAER